MQVPAKEIWSEHPPELPSFVWVNVIKVHSEQILVKYDINHPAGMVDVTHWNLHLLYILQF